MLSAPCVVGQSSSEPREAAQRFPAAESPELRALRLWARELWDAAQTLGPDAERPNAAQVAIHRSAVAKILETHEPASFTQTRDRLQAAINAPESAAAGALLRQAHRILLGELEAPLTAARGALIRRGVLLGGVTFAAVVMGVVLLGLVQWLREPADLARGKPFTLSSKWADCYPDQMRCGGYPTRVFFHTLEQPQPWFQYDLGAPTTFSRLTIQNRTDIALMAAVPLVVELSDDGTTFREVARRTERFVEWRPSFEPQTARFVRLRVDRTSALHLEAVRVHR